MAYEPFVGEIMNFGGTFAPNGWLLCDGRLLPIARFSALFSVIGTSYGGNGTTNFQLPDLRGRMAIHRGQGPGLTDYAVGSYGGAEHVTLSLANLPPHSHRLRADATDGGAASPAAHALGVSAAAKVYGRKPPGTALSGRSILSTGIGTPFDNRQPYVALSFCIAYVGIYPTRP